MLEFESRRLRQTIGLTLSDLFSFFEVPYQKEKTIRESVF